MAFNIFKGRNREAAPQPAVNKFDQLRDVPFGGGAPKPYLGEPTYDQLPNGGRLVQHGDMVMILDSPEVAQAKNEQRERARAEAEAKRHVEMRQANAPANIFKNELHQKFIGGDPREWAVIPGVLEHDEEIKAYDDYKRQQNRLMAGLVGGIEAFANPPEVTTQQKSQILDMISDGKINRGTMRGILQGIKGPEQQIGPDAMAEKITQDTHQARIMDFLGDVRLNHDQVTGAAIQSFLYKYRTPIDFDDAKISFLNMIRSNNSEAKYMEYVDAMSGLTKALYGKKQEYFSQMLDLERQAEEKNGR